MGKLERIAEKLRSGRRNRGSNRSGDGNWGTGDRKYDNRRSTAERLKKDLLREYNGTDLLSETDFELVSTEYGKTLHLEESVDQAFEPPNTTSADILSDLKLVYGIGSVRERELKEQGFETVADLLDHEKWGEEAQSVHSVFQGELTDAYYLLRRWKSLSHPSFLKLSGLFDRQQFAIVDIETLGLSNQPVFLLGLAHPHGSEIVVHQFLAEDLDQELATLMNFTRHLEERKVIVTYNGKNFDIPYIERRLGYYGERKKFSHPHLDLYLFTRKVIGERTRNCKLGTIER